MAAIYSNGGNRWNILGFNFTKRDALSSLYKISMDKVSVNTLSQYCIERSYVDIQLHPLSLICHTCSTYSTAANSARFGLKNSG